MSGYRLTLGDTQARFDPLGRLTHIGHPDRIKDSPTPFYTQGPLREGHWYVNCGKEDHFFDPETTTRHFDYDAGTFTLKSAFRGPLAWWGLNLNRTYRLEGHLLRCDFTLENWSPTGTLTVGGSAAPICRLRYVTGVNSWTDYSSEWKHRPYPTNVRVEQDFLWAGMISTAHDVIGFFSASKFDSWQVIYEGSGSQRIRTLALDAVNSLDLHPERVRHQDVRLTGKDLAYSGTFYIGRFASMEALWQSAADTLGVAFVNAERCAGFVGETLKLPVIAPASSAKAVKVRVSDEKTGEVLDTLQVRGGQVAVPLRGKTGRHVLQLDCGGKTTEARVWKQEGWSDTLRGAAHHAVNVKRPTGGCAENILGLITLAQAGGLLGDDLCRAAARETMDRVYANDFDRATGRHKHMHNRLQNYGSFLDAVRIYHECFNTTEFLDDAHRSAEQLLSLQRSDGHLYNNHSIYDNVIHPVKSLFDWGHHLRKHGKKAEGDRAIAAVERAYRNLAHEGDDTHTEGSDHFEDGMTSCAGYQIAALWPHFGRKPADLQMAVDIFNRRRMLKPRVPDSRYFASTLRHWEGYWAMGLGEAMLGGHGWNAWSASMSHALFMATGQWSYLVDAYATITNCLQSVDLETGDFNFGFSVDPFWRDYYGLGVQHRGEVYVPPPAEIAASCESHSAFLTLDDSFFRQTYVRVGKDGVEVLNGRLVSAGGNALEIESFALALREVVVALDDAKAPVPAVKVAGKPATVVRAG